MIYFRVIKAGYHIHKHFGVRNLIDIAENNDIIRFAILHGADQLILLELVTLMRGHAAHRGIVYRHIEDLVLKLPEHRPVLCKDHRFGFAGKRDRRFFNDKFIHVRRHNVHPQFQNIQFVKKRDAVVYHKSNNHAFPSACGIYRRRVQISPPEQ